MICGKLPALLNYASIGVLFCWMSVNVLIGEINCFSPSGECLVPMEEVKGFVRVLLSSMTGCLPSDAHLLQFSGNYVHNPPLSIQCCVGRSSRP